MKRALVFSILLASAGGGVAQDRRPTHENVKYGPHVRNVMDVWLAKSDKPTPVLVSIHGNLDAPIKNQGVGIHHPKFDLGSLLADHHS